MPARIAPSILSADFANLAGAIDAVGPEADTLHVDVMDGHFVPNLTIGPPVVKSLRRHTDLYLDCHLMITNPADHLEAFQAAGANGCSVHVEVGGTAGLIDQMRALALDVGLVLNPETPFDAVLPFLDRIDLLLVMTVHPGFGGQKFIADCMAKVRAARAEIDNHGLHVALQVDGGIDVATAPVAAEAGADVFVAGSAIFGNDDPPRRGGAPPGRRVVHRHRVNAKILTVSTAAAVGERDDASGDALEQALVAGGFDVVERAVVTDGADAVADALRRLLDGFAGLVVTTGGTGFAPSDQTPEGTLAIVERPAPGLAEAMRLVNPLGRLSRGVAGVAGGSIIINTPGSTKGAVECLGAVIDVLPHALDLLGGGHPH